MIINQVGGGGRIEERTKYITPGRSPKAVYPSSGYDGMKKVYVYGDSELIGENIKKDVSIFGTKGTYAPPQDIHHCFMGWNSKEPAGEDYAYVVTSISINSWGTFFPSSEKVEFHSDFMIEKVPKMPSYRVNNKYTITSYYTGTRGRDLGMLNLPSGKYVGSLLVAGATWRVDGPLIMGRDASCDVSVIVDSGNKVTYTVTPTGNGGIPLINGDDNQIFIRRGTLYKQ